LLAGPDVVGIDGAGARPGRTAAFEIATIAGFDVVRGAVGIESAAAAMAERAILVEAVAAGPLRRNARTDGVVVRIDAPGTILAGAAGPAYLARVA